MKDRSKENKKAVNLFFKDHFFLVFVKGELFFSQPVYTIELDEVNKP